MTKLERSFIFYPETNYVVLPEHFGLAAEDVVVPTEDGGQVHGWYFEPEAAPRAYVLFSHGNAGNISGRLPLAEELVRRGLAVLMYDYRGYGQSPGDPTEKGCYRDAEAALTALLERAGDPSRVVLFGRSLGAGVSWEMAARHPELAGIISDCAFTSIPDMAGRMFPVPFLGKVLQTRFDNHEKIATVTLPKLLMHGEQDELIPFEMGEKLWDAAAEPKRFVPLPGAGHNDTYLVEPEFYFGTVSSFIDEVVGQD